MAHGEPTLRSFLGALCVMLGLGGCSETFAPAADGSAAYSREAGSSLISEADYQIAPLDILEISVFQVKDLDGIRQVSRTGYISLPLIGELPAKGRSVKQLERDIAGRLGANYLRAPDVHVSVKEYTSQRFTVEGAVGSPGTYSMKGPTTLLQAIAEAKGLTKIADRDVAIFRIADRARGAKRYNLSAIRSGELEDPAVMGGDVIVVGESAIRSAWTEFKDIFTVGLQGAGLATRFFP